MMLLHLNRGIDHLGVRFERIERIANLFHQGVERDQELFFEPKFRPGSPTSKFQRSQERQYVDH